MIEALEKSAGFSATPAGLQLAVAGESAAKESEASSPPTAAVAGDTAVAEETALVLSPLIGTFD